MPYVIGVTGPKGVGKNYVAEHFIAPVFGGCKVEFMAFAEPLKAILLAMDPLLPDGSRLSEHDLEEVKRTEPEVRRLLQRLGTEGVRTHLGQDVWVDAMKTRLAATDAEVVILTDVRFPNEAALCDLLIGVKGPRAQDDAVPHASEQMLRVDVVLWNA